ncbi:hypothetical protein V8D89_003396 [Ganoderma adspersum]
MPPNAHSPHSTPSPHTHTSSLSNVSSTPPMPASSTVPGGGLSRLNSNANTFTPKRVTIKSESVQEVDLERWMKQAPVAVSSPVVPSSPACRIVQVRFEIEEEKKKRWVEEKVAESESFGLSSAPTGAQNLKIVASLEASPNCYTSTSLVKKSQSVDWESPEVVDRMVRALLNDLTMERFDPISDQIISWANRSEKEKDARTLIQMVRLVFEKATDKAMWSEMYARLCQKMTQQISPNVHNYGIKNADGKPVASGRLFCKYLLNRCQDDFERGWVAKEATAAAATTKASDGQTVKAVTEQNKGEEDVRYSDEYYAAEKARRQGLGLIKFIGELFKLQMLTERIMHECVKKLLGNVENPGEEEIESLCTFMTTVGQVLDTPKARARMDVYFSRMKGLTKSPNVNSRTQLMLQDVIELREGKWIPRNQVAAPMTIAAIHEQATKKRIAREKAFNPQISMSCGGSRRGGERTGDHAQVGPDGWAVAGGAAPRPPPKAGDLSKFGKIDKSAPMTFGPSSVFQTMFSMLSGNPEMAAEVAGKSSCPPNRKSSIDLGPGGSHTASIDLGTGDSIARGTAPSKWAQTYNRNPTEFFPTHDLQQAAVGVVEDVVSEPVFGSYPSPVDLPSNPVQPRMSRRTADEHIERSVTLLSGLHDVGAALVVFRDLPASYHSRLVNRLVSGAMEPCTNSMRGQVLAYFFRWAAERHLCSTAAFEEGVSMTMTALEDIAAEVPDAFERYAVIVMGMGLFDDPGWRACVLERAGPT